MELDTLPLCDLKNMLISKSQPEFDIRKSELLFRTLAYCCGIFQLSGTLLGVK